MVQNLGFKVTFSNGVRADFESKIKKAEGGIVRVFGIAVHVGGDHTLLYDNATHVGKWDGGSGEFTVTPTEEGAFASVVAIQGAKSKTSA